MTAPCARRGASSRPEAQSSLAAPTGLRLPDTPDLDSDSGGERTGGARTPRHFVAARTRRAAAGLFLFFLALLGIQGVAHAQQEIFSGTLTVGATSTSPDLFGFHTNFGFGDLGTIADRTIRELSSVGDNQDRYITVLHTNVNGNIILAFSGTGAGRNMFDEVINYPDPLDVAAFRARVTLYIGTTPFAMADASWNSFSEIARWTNSGLSWAAGETYSVRITLADQAAVLHLTPSSISENGGSSTVTATLSTAARETTTLTVSAAAVSPAVAADFALSSNTTLTIAAGATTSTGTVTIDAVNNAVDAPDKEVTISASGTTNTQGVTAPADLTLTIKDDEPAPTATLHLSSPSISENGGSSMVTATLSHVSSAETTLTVSATAGTNTVPGDFELSADTTLTIAAGATMSTGTVTIAAANNSTDDPNKEVTVSASTVNAQGVNAPANLTLTIEDDEGEPTARLTLTPDSIGEDGGLSTVTAKLSHVSSAETVLTVSAAAVSPAVPADFLLSDNTTLRIAAGATTSTGTVTIAAVNNSVDAPDKSLTVSASAANTQGVNAIADLMLTIEDDDEAPTATLILIPDSIGENGGSTTVTAKLSHVSSAETVLTVAATAVSPAVAAEFELSADTTLTIAAGATMSAGTVTITAVNNSTDDPNKEVTVSASAANTQGVNAPADVTLTIVDDESLTATAVLHLTPPSIGEDGGSSTVTATLSHVSSADTTLTVSATAGVNTVPGDFELSADTTLTIAAGDTTSTGTVTIDAVNNSTDDPNKQVTVTASAVNTQGVNAPADLTLTIEDDEGEPTARLILTLDSIGEDGGSSTVTAELNRVSNAETVLTVSAAAVSPAVPADFLLSSNSILRIAAGATTSTGTVTIAAVNNGVDAPDKLLTVSASAANTQGLSAIADLTLTIEDDEDAPTATLILTPDSIGENGGPSTVTAELSHVSSVQTTLTVSATAGANTVPGDFALSANTTLRIAAGSTTSTGAVTIAPVNNSTDDPNKKVNVSASAANTNGVNAPADLRLTIVDDESLTAVLHLSSPTIGENGGLTKVTATLNLASSAETTLTVSAAAVSPAVAANFRLSSNKTLRIAAGSTTSTGTVTIVAVNNGVDAPDKSLTVSANAVNANGVNAPAGVALTIEDDEEAPTAVLHLSSPTIGENGGSSTVTATLSHRSSEATTITVAATADFTLSTDTTLTIAAGSTTSTGTVTITAVNNTTDDPNKEVTVSASAANTQGVNAPADVTLTIVDDEGEPTARLILTPDSIGEDGGSSTVTAELSHVSSAETVLTVSAVAVSPAVAADFLLSDNTTLRIAAGATTSTGTVTIAAVNNGVDAPDKLLTVSANAANTQGVNAIADVTLTIEDDEEAPAATLILTPDSISEDGGSSTVTAELSHASSETTTITVSAAAISSTYIFRADSELSDNTTLTIAAGSTTSTGTVTIDAVNNSVDAPDREVRVRARAANTQGVTAPADVTLTIEDDEEAPTATLILTPDSIGENGGSSTVTAELSHASSKTTTITVSAAAVSPAVAADFELSANTILRIYAGTTTSTGTVTIVAVNNSVDALAKEVRVRANVVNSQGVNGPADVTLTIEDDEEAPTAVLHLTPNSIGEAGGSSTVTATLSHVSSAETTLTVSATAGDNTVPGDFELSADTTLTIAAGDTTSTGSVTIDAVNNSTDDPNKHVTVTASAANAQGVNALEAVTLTIEDDEGEPTARLILTPDSIGEDGGSSTVTAKLNRVSSAETVLTVSAVAVSPAVAADFLLSDNTTLRIAAGATTSTGTVTIAAVNNGVDAPDKSLTVSASAANTNGVNAIADVTLTIEDDEETPTATLILTPDTIGEDGGSSTVTAELSHVSSAETTLTVALRAVSPALAADFSLSAATTLTIAAGATTSTGTVTIAAVNNSVDAPDREVTVSASATNTQGVNAPADLTLTIEDDEEAPTVTLILTPDTISENGGLTKVTATLSHASSKFTRVTVATEAEVGFELSANKNLRIESGTTTSTKTVTITAVNNSVDAPDKEVTVSASATNARGVNAPADLTLTIEDDEETPTARLILTPDSIGEDGGSSTVTAELNHPSSAETTLTVSAMAGANTVPGDFELSAATTLTIAAGATRSTGTVTIAAVNNSAEGPNKEVTVAASAVNARGVNGPAAVPLTIIDGEGEGEPTVVLHLTPDSIGENGGSSTVTATLSKTSSAETVLTVTVAAVSPAVAADFALSATITLRIAAGATMSTETVTISAVNNSVDAPDKQVTVSASAANTQGVTDPAEVTLTIEDDEEAPTATLILTPDSINESGSSNTSTVTAELSHPSSEDTTLTVMATAGAEAADGDFTLIGAELMIASGDTTSTGTVTITAVNNDTYELIKQVTVSASAVNTQGVTAPADVLLIIEDDDEPPTVTLHLSSSSISENGGSTTVTATLSHASSRNLAVGVLDGVVSPDFERVGFSIFFNAGMTTSDDTVTINAIDNDVDAPDKQVTVSWVVAGLSELMGMVTLTIEDDEEAPTATLILTPDSIDEDGGSSTVTAELSHPSSEETTLVVSTTSGANAADGDFELSAATTLTIAAGDTASTGTVTIAAVNNDADELNKEVTVTASATNTQGVTVPAAVTLTIEDDESPTATLILTPDSISENAGSSTVTATLSHVSSAETVLTVTVVAVSPAVAADFALSATITLRIAAGATMSTGTVTISAVNNSVDAPDKQVTVSAIATNTQGVSDPSSVTLTIEDDEEAPTATLILTPDSISESGSSNTSTVTAELSHPSSAATTIAVSATAGIETADADFTLSASPTLTINPGDTTSTGTVTITAVNNDVDEFNKRVTVSASAANAQGANGPADVTLTIEDDEEAPTATLHLSSSSISEDGGSSTVTATLSHASSFDTAIFVLQGVVSPDFELDSNFVLVIFAGVTMSTETVTINAIDNDVDAPDKEVTVSATVTNGVGVNAPADVTLTIEDDEESPTATLILTPDSISESGSSNTSTVTAELSHPSSEDTTLTVMAAAGANAADGDFTLTGAELTIAAGDTTSTGTVTIVAVNNAVDAPDKEVTVSGSAANSQGVTGPADVTLTIEDDEESPTASLILTLDTIGENGGSSTVTATLSGTSSAETVLTVSVAALSPAVAADFELSANTTLRIAAGATSSTGTVTITAANNSVDAPDKSLTVSATASNTVGVTAPANVTLTIEDDEEAPTATLTLTPDSISENVGSSTVTATLSHASSEETTLTVSAAAGANAADGDFNLSATTTLTIAAGNTMSTGTVTISAVNNSVDAPNKEVTVSATATNGVGVNAPADVTLTIEDDEESPTATLILTPDSISESGSSNTSTVTAELSHPSSEDTTLTVMAAAGANAADGDFTLTGAELMIAAGGTMSTGTVTIVAVNNAVDAPDKEVTVSASAANSQGVTGPADVTLTIEDDEAATMATATLILTLDTIGENAGSSTVTATLSETSSAETVLTVSVAALSPAVAADFELSANTTLRIAAGATSSTGTVTITAVNNSVDAPDKTLTVSASAANTVGVTAPANVTLTIEDDEEAPTATLTLTPDSISENVGASAVTATLSHASSEETVLTVSATAVSPAVAADFTLSATTTLTIAAGNTMSTGTVTIASVNNSVDAPDKTLTVSASAANTQGVTAPANMTLTIEDDEEAPTATLTLTPDSISENVGSSTVTATLSHASSEETTLTVSAAAGANAADGDFNLSATTTLTIAAGNTMSTGTVTISAVNNSVNEPNKEVTVSASATNSQGVTDPAEVTLTIEDDEGEATARLILTPDSISENGASSTVTAELSHVSSALTTLTVSVAAVSPAVAADFELSASITLTIDPGDTTSTGTVTITAVNNDVDAPNKEVTVSATLTNSDGVTAPADVTLIITDDEEAPTATLILTPDSINEDGGSSTVTAELSHPSSEETTLTVSALAGANTVPGDFRLSAIKTLTIAAGDKTSTGTVTIDAVNNGVDAPDKEVTVRATSAVNAQGVTAPAEVTLTIEDDEEAPTVTLHLSPSSISENGGSTTVTATLSHASSENTAVPVLIGANSPDFELDGNFLIIIFAGVTMSTDTVTINAIDNDVDAPDKEITVTANASNTQGVNPPANVTLTIEDDEETPTATLILTPDSIDEDGGSSTVTAELSHPSSAATTIAVTATAGTETADGDFTLSASPTLTINPGDTTSTGTVTITAVNNDVDEFNKAVTVSASATNSQGVNAPAFLTLTIEDDEESPMVTLHLSTSSISEDGGSSTVTATLSHASSEETTLTVSATAGDNTVPGDFELSANTTLTIDAGDTTSTGTTVTIAAVNNDVDAPDKEVTVSATDVVNGVGVNAPADVTLTIEDDEEAPTATLILTPDSIDEDGGSSTVTAELSHPSSEDTTLTVSAAAGAHAADGDFTLTGAELTIAAGGTTSTGTVTIVAANNGVDAPDKEVTVSASAANSQGVTAPADVTLTIEDDEETPMATLILTPDLIGESGSSNTSTVTAELTHPSSAETTLDVSAMAGTNAVSGDFDLSATTLTIAPGVTTSTETVTITAIDNEVDAPDKEITVSADASNMQGVNSPADVTLTIEDDEEAPTVTLILSPDSISESGDSSTTTVTATLSHASSENTVIQVLNGMGSPDFGLGSNFIIIIFAGATTSTDTVTINAIDNEVDAPDKEITVSADASNMQGVNLPADVTLTIEDDEEAPTVTLILSPDSISESGDSNTTTVTATLSHTSSEETTLTVSATAGDNTVPGDFELSANTTLTIAAGDTTSTGTTVTIAAVNNRANAPDKEVTVSASAVNTQGVTAPADVMLTIEDDEGEPRITLILSPDSISESGDSNTTTVSASMFPVSSAETTITVSAAAGANAADGDFELSATTTLTIAANSASAFGTVTITAVDNSEDGPNKEVTVSASVVNSQGVKAPANRTLTIEDDEETPTATLVLASDSISEDGGSSTVTATLSHASSEATRLTVSASPGFNTFRRNFALSSNKILTIAAGDTTSTGMVTIEAVNNGIHTRDKKVQVKAIAFNPQGVNAPADLTLTIEDDEETPTATLILAPDSISENGGSSTVTATLSHTSSATTTITVLAAAGANAVDGDFTLSANKTLTINAGDTSSTGTVVMIETVDNNVDAPDKEVTVSASATNLLGVNEPANMTLIIEDDEDAPIAELILTPDSIGENGQSSTVTAMLSHASSEATTITVAAAAVLPALAADFDLSANPTLTIAAGDTMSTGTVTIAAVNNDANEPDKEVTVSAVADNAQGVTAPASVTLTLSDDEGSPTVTLILTPSSISENGGSSTVTAELSHASSAETTVTVSAAAGAHAVDGDFTLSGTTLTIAPGVTTSTGTVTIGAVNNDADEPDKEVTVSAVTDNAQGVTAPANVTLTIEDDEGDATARLILTPNSISENGGSSTVTAQLSNVSSAETVLIVSVAALSPAVAADFELSSNTTLRIAAGATSSTGTVTIAAVNNSVDAPNKEVTVSATADNTQGVTAPANVTLTLTDDEGSPTVTLILTPSSISENGGSSTVTAQLSHASSAATTVTVSAAAGAHAAGGDFTLSGTELMIASGVTTSTGTVTIGAVNNDADESNKEVTVSASTSNAQGVTAPASVTLTLTDDEGSPTVTLILTPDTISENGGSSTVTAELSHASNAATTVTVSAAAGANAVDGDFTLSGTTLTIAPGVTTSTGTVTIGAVNNGVNAPDKEVTVSASASNTQGVTAPADLTLTIEDDEGEPTARLILTPDSIGENGGSSTVEATLNRVSSAETTLTVSAMAGANTVPGDFELSANATLTIAAGTTTSTGTVTIAAVNNTSDDPIKQVTVSASAANMLGVTAPADLTLTIEDDEEAPTAVLHLSSLSIGENGQSSTVTATFSHASSEATTITVSAVAVSPALAADFLLSANTTLNIAAGSTTSTGTVTITAVNNSVDAPDKSLTVTASAANTLGVTAPADLTLTIEDDEETPTATLILTPDSIDENSGPSTVTAELSHASSEVTTLTVSVVAGANATGGDFELSVNTTLNIAAGSTTSTGTVTIGAVDNSADGPNREVTVSASATNLLGVTAPANVTLIIEDDEDAPIAELILTPDSIGENGGSSTVTATLSHASSEATTITVAAAAVLPALAADFSLSANPTLTIAAGDTMSTGTVTIAAVNNSVDAPDKQVTVSASATNLLGVTAPANVTLTIEDDEEAPTAELHLSLLSIGENGGSTAVRATLSHASSEVTTITVSAAAGANAADGDFSLSANPTLTIAAGDTTSTGTVTIDAVNNDADQPNKEVTVSASAVNTQGVTGPEDVTLTLLDDEGNPSVVLHLSLLSIGENGGSSTVRATLSHVSSATTTITVLAAAGANAADEDFSLSANPILTIDAGETMSTGTVTIEAVNNFADGPNKEVTVSASATNSAGVTAPADVTLTITDDEGSPTVTLILTPDSIDENKGSSTVTAELSHVSGQETTLTVAASVGDNTADGDFALSTNTVLTIAAGTTISTGTVTIDAVDNSVDGPNKEVTVRADAVNSAGVTVPSDVTLTIIDDEGEPTVTLILTPDSINENSGSSTVTAELSHASGQKTTLTVAAAGANAADGDFILSPNTTLTIAAGMTTSTGTVTIDAVDNTKVGSNKEVTVSASASNTQGVSGPLNVKLTIVDDEEVPTATLILTPDSISENNGSSTVTATLNNPSNAETTLTVSVTPGANATGGDFTLSANKTLTIVAGATSSTGTVTINAVDNTEGGSNREVTVSASVANSAGVIAPVDITLTIVDDEDRLLPKVTLAVKALLTRIGRTAAAHVVDAVGTRLFGTKSASHVTLAGQRLPFSDAPLPQANTFVGKGPWDVRPYNHEWNQISGEREDLQGTSVRSITSREMLAGSSFSLRLAEDDDESRNTGKWTAWGLTAQSDIDGRDGDLMLNGDVTTVIMGVDAELRQTMAGVAVAHSSGDSAFEVDGSCDDPRCKGTLNTQLTGVYPYLHHDVNERVSISGVLGYAKGDLAYSGDNSVAGIESRTAAFSTRGTLQPVPSENGFELAVRLDAFLNWVRTEETVDLEAIETDTSRLRLALEASRTLALDSDRTLTSTLQLGVRHDGGDAEIGHGVDIKAALRYADPARGLSVEGTLHKLISHEDANYEEQGVSASVRLSPDAAGLGLSLSLASSWSAGATRTNNLWSILNAETSSENSNFNSATRLDAELGYGLPAFGNQSVQTPYFGFSLSDSADTTERLGWRLQTGSDFTLKLEAARHHQSDGETPQNSIELQAAIRW